MGTRRSAVGNTNRGTVAVLAVEMFSKLPADYVEVPYRMQIVPKCTARVY